MPTRRRPEAMARYNQAARAQRTARQHRRHMVPVRDRTPDDGQVDEVAIDLALRGWRRHGGALTRAELVEAVREGTRRGISTPDLADALCLHEREVQRLKAEGRAATTQAPTSGRAAA